MRFGEHAIEHSSSKYRINQSLDTGVIMKEKEQRIWEYCKSALRYIQLSWPIYLFISILVFGSWAITMPFNWFPMEKPSGIYNHWIEFLANLAPSLAAAFVILWLTDFISKEHLERIFLEQKEGAKTIQEAFDWGLKVYPSHSHEIIRSREQVLDDYLEEKDTVRILSGRGAHWFDNSNGLLQRLLMKKDVKVEAVLFSPELYSENTLAAAEFIDDSIRRKLIEYLSTEQKFCRYVDKGVILIDNHKKIKDELDGLSPSNRAKITVRYTGIIPLCEFFIIGDKRAHGSVPMHTKIRVEAFSIQTFRGLRSGSENVKEFINEFNHFWKPDNSISEEEYFSKYAKVS